MYLLIIAIIVGLIVAFSGGNKNVKNAYFSPEDTGFDKPNDNKIIEPLMEYKREISKLPKGKAWEITKKKLESINDKLLKASFSSRIKFEKILHGIKKEYVETYLNTPTVKYAPEGLRFNDSHMFYIGAFSFGEGEHSKGRWVLDQRGLVYFLSPKNPKLYIVYGMLSQISKEINIPKIGEAFTIEDMNTIIDFAYLLHKKPNKQVIRIQPDVNTSPNKPLYDELNNLEKKCKRDLENIKIPPAASRSDGNTKKGVQKEAQRQFDTATLMSANSPIPNLQYSPSLKPDQFGMPEIEVNIKVVNSKEAETLIADVDPIDDEIAEYSDDELDEFDSLNNVPIPD
jgi:predicted Zn-ribbon and HTH transcriptional regulator